MPLQPPKQDGRYLQGYFSPLNRQKYIGDPAKKIVYRSSWEMMLLLRLDRNPNVVEWASESFAVLYQDVSTKGADGCFALRRYYPDFFIRYKDGEKIRNIVVEIKPWKETQPPKASTKRLLKEAQTFARNVSKWKACRAFCERKGWEFVVITEKDLPTFLVN